LWVTLVAQHVDEVLRLVLLALSPDILVVGQADVGVQGVARLHGLHRDRVGGVVGARRHAEENILRVHGVQATVLAEAQPRDVVSDDLRAPARDRKSTRLNSSHVSISYAVFCLKKKKMKRK